MKGKISLEGYLLIQRHNLKDREYYKPAACPASNFKKNCGDFCALFNEPKQYDSNNKWILNLCGMNVLEFNEFEDERMWPRK